MYRSVHPLHLVLGPMIWGGWLVAMYASLSVVCSLFPPAAGEGVTTWINGVLLVLTFIVTLLLVLLASWCRRTASADNSITCLRPFISQVAAGVYLISASSTLMIGLPVIVLPPCI